MKVINKIFGQTFSVCKGFICTVIFIVNCLFSEFMEFENIAVDELVDKNGLFVNRLSSLSERPKYCEGKVRIRINSHISNVIILI